VANQSLHLNSYIKVGGVPFFSRALVDKGILFVKDVINGCEFLTYLEFKTKYPDVNFNWLEYTSLISAIPAVWKILLRDNKNVYYEHKYDTLLKVYPKITHAVYGESVANTENLMSVYSKWVVMGYNSTYERFMLLFRMNKITTSVKMRSFHYRLLMRRIFLNNILYKWKVVDSPLCTFCHKAEENYEHLFSTCEISSQIWEDVKQYLLFISVDKVGFEVCNFDTVNILLNLVHPKRDHYINTFILYIKQYLFRCKCLQKIPCKFEIQYLIKDVVELEFSAAQKLGSLTMFYDKWSSVDVSGIV
jgi:hypothetical protein